MGFFRWGKQELLLSERGVCLGEILELSGRLIHCEEALEGRAAAEEKVPRLELETSKSGGRFVKTENGFESIYNRLEWREGGETC